MDIGLDILTGGSGQRRKHIETATEPKEEETTKAALPSPFFLDDFVMPKDAGVLEKKVFFVAYTSLQPVNSIFDYLFSGADSRIIGNFNPRYLVYKALEFPVQNYLGYAAPQDGSVSAYQSEQAYGPSSSFVAYRSTLQTEIKPYTFPLPKPEELFAPEYRQANSAPNYDMPKHAIEALSHNLWEASPYFVGFYKPFTESLMPSTQTQKEIPKKTLDFIVAKTPDVKTAPFRMIYSISIGIPAHPIQANTRGIELIAQAAFVHQKQNQPKSPYTGSRQPNYDSQKQYIDIMSSSFWRESSSYEGEYRADGNLADQAKKDKVHGNGVYRRRKRNPKNDGKYDIKKLKKAEKESKKKTKRIAAKEQTNGHKQNHVRNPKTYHTNSQMTEYSPQKQQYDEKNQPAVALYLAAISKIAFLFERGVRYLLNGKNKFRGEHKAFIADYENWRGRAEKDLGVKIYDFFMDTKTSSTYGHGENVVVPSASLNKIGIGDALVSMLQEGRLDINKEVPHIPELVLDRETRKYKQFGKDGNKSHKLADLNVLMEKFSCNGATNHILYALGHEDDYKENPTPAEIKRQIDKGMQIVMNYASRKGVYIKMEAPYVDEPKLRVLGYSKDWSSNTTTAKDIGLLMASTQADGHLSEEYRRMWVEPLEQEETMQWFKRILGVENAPGKPGIDRHNNGYAIVLNGKVLTIILDQHPSPIYDNPDNKSEIHNTATPQGKKTFNYLAELGTILHNYWVNPSQKKVYNPIFLDVLKSAKPNQKPA
ncbi:serine hydrolase [Candidatus Woesearchaeota archaeon]|nr:serine hydrolase [Candidatus Woesearchaeota archaeon]